MQNVKYLLVLALGVVFYQLELVERYSVAYSSTPKIFRSQTRLYNFIVFRLYYCTGGRDSTGVLVNVKDYLCRCMFM